MAYNQTELHAYPSEAVDPKKKNKDYIAQYGRAFLSEFLTQGGDRWYNARDAYKELIDYATGRQSIERYKNRIDDNKPTKGHTFKKHNIDYSILPIIPKYLHLVDGLVSQTQYEATATAIDAMAQDEREDYEYKLRAQMKHRDLVSIIQPAGLEPDTAQIPLDEDEVQFKTTFGWKHWAATKVETGLHRSLYHSGYEQLQPEFDSDARVFGHFLAKDYLENGEPRMKRIDPRYGVVPYSEFEDYRDIRKCGHFEPMTIGDLKQIAGDQLTEDQYEQIAKQTGTQTTWRYNPIGIYGMPYDSHKIMPFFFEFLSYDEMVFKKTKDQRGNDVVRERGFESNKKENIRKGYRCLYEGAIIPNTNFSFNCRRAYDQKRDPNNIADCFLTYHPHSPGMRYGVPVSMVEKIRVPADLAQRAWLRLNDAIARAVPKGFAYDLDKLENIALGSGEGTNLTTGEIIEFHRMTGDYLFRGRDAAGNEINGRAGILEMENGLPQDIQEYFSIIREAVAQIEGITGINQTAAGMTNPDIGKGVSEIALQSANNAIGYLYHARRSFFQRICKALAMRVYDQLERGEIRGAYVKSNGMKQKTEMVSISREEAKKIVKHRFDFTITVKPTQQEWQMFYQDMQRCLDNQTITLADATFLREVDNLKQARALLSIREKRNKMEAAQKAQADMQANAQVQTESAQAAELAKQETLKLEWQLKDNHVLVKGEDARKTQAERYEYELQLDANRGAVKIETTVQQGQDAKEVKEIEGDNYLEQTALAASLNVNEPQQNY